MHPAVDRDKLYQASGSSYHEQNELPEPSALVTDGSPNWVHSLNSDEPRN